MGLEMPDSGEITNGDLSYNKLIEHIDDGIIHIPEFQREFVWTEQKILDLLDSIYQSYPIGSLIFWVTTEEFAYSSPIGNNRSKSSSLYKSRFFVIDGQQRLKSLYHAAKALELEMESGTKKIDIVFDLESEKFVLRENIRNRRKSAPPIPGFRDDKLILRILNAIEEGSVDECKDDYDLSDNQLEYFFGSLDRLGLLRITEDDYELTTIGQEILTNEDKDRIAHLLVDNVEFIKETLEIIQETPGITRSEARPDFQALYGGAKTTAYQQFGRRCKWLRTLGVVEKRDGGYYLTESADSILEDIRRTEQQLRTQFVPLDKILVDQSELDLDYLSNFPSEKQNRINELRKVFGNYDFPIILVNQSDWDKVCDIFERINTQGQKLTVVDLMIAKTWSGDEFNLREELETFQTELGEDIPDITILQALSLNVSGQCRRQDILGLDSRQVQDNWYDVIESIRKSVDFLKNNIHLPTFDLLPYPAQLVPLSRFFYELGNDEPTNSQKEALVRWFWRSGFSNRFDSAVATKLEDDGTGMESIADGLPIDFNYSYSHRSEEDIIDQKYTLQNAFVKTLICLFASKQPRNPINNALVSNDNFSRYKQREMHHIFPRNYLRENGVEDQLINSIVNIMFLPANVNNDERFSNPPSEYLSEIDNPRLQETLETHLIYDLNESGLLQDDYSKFLGYRARRILDTIEEATGEERFRSGARSLSPDTPFTNEMYVRELVRNADSYIYWFDKYFTRAGLEYLIDEVNPEQVDEIQILTGTAQTDHRLRSQFQDFVKEMNAKGVKAEMRVLSGDTARDIHDRWFMAENYSYDIPSINTIRSNQYAEIAEAAERPPFSDWWGESYDIIHDWNEIQKLLD